MQHTPLDWMVFAGAIGADQRPALVLSHRETQALDQRARSANRHILVE